MNAQTTTTAPNARDYADPIVFSLAYNAYRRNTAARVSDPTAVRTVQLATAEGLPWTRTATAAPATAPAVLAEGTPVTVTEHAGLTRSGGTSTGTVTGTQVRADGQRVYFVADRYRVTRAHLATMVQMVAGH